MQISSSHHKNERNKRENWCHPSQFRFRWGEVPLFFNIIYVVEFVLTEMNAPKEEDLPVK